MGNKKALPVPEPSEVEPKFVTIMAPYPFYANLELPEDRLAMARWLGCVVVDPKWLHAIWWKPSTANLVILEVSRELPAIERLLGEHKWSRFLLHPSSEEKPLFSRAYYSYYRTAEHLQREGWKCIDIEDGWFEKWRPQNGIVRYPYPASTWCELPREDVTNLHLCLNIPRDLFGLGPAKFVLPKATPLVPGSAEWVKANANGGPCAPGPGARQGKKQIAAATVASTKSAWNKPLVVSASKAATPPQQVTPLFPDDPSSVPFGAPSDAAVMQHLSWSDDVDQADRERLAEEEAAAEPLSVGEQATVYPPPPSSSSDDEEAVTTPYDYDAGGDDNWQQVWGAKSDLPRVVINPEVINDATAGPQRKERDADSGYAGGQGRSLFEAAGWICPSHGTLKNCPLGICHDAKQARRRLERQQNGAWGTRDSLAQWSTGGPKMEVRAVAPGGGSRGWGPPGGGSRSASTSRAQSGSRPPQGGGRSGGEGGAWRSSSKSAQRVR